VRLLLTSSHIPISLEDSDCIFVDYTEVSIDQKTSSSLTDHRYKFREDVIQRDGLFCVFTRQLVEDCDATHIIPRSKGDEVKLIIILCDTSIMFYSSTLRKLSDIVLLFITLHLQFLGLMMFRMECCCQQGYIPFYLQERLPF
jgi:hypothetical protein